MSLIHKEHTQGFLCRKLSLISEGKYTRTITYFLLPAYLYVWGILKRYSATSQFKNFITASKRQILRTIKIQIKWGSTSYQDSETMYMKYCMNDYNLQWYGWNIASVIITLLLNQKNTCISYSLTPKVSTWDQNSNR